MNPGYLSFLIISMIFILLASGWKEQLIQGISQSAIAFFFLGWFSLICVQLRIGGFQVNLGYIALLAGALLVIAVSGHIVFKMHVLSTSLLTGSMYILFMQVYRMNPMAVVYNPRLDLTIVLGLLLALFIRAPLPQLSAMTLGLMLGKTGYSLIFQRHMPHQFGSFEFYDGWWLLLLMTRVLSGIVHQLLKGYRFMIRLWQENRKGVDE